MSRVSMVCACAAKHREQRADSPFLDHDGRAVPAAPPQAYPAERAQVDPSSLCVEELATSIG